MKFFHYAMIVIGCVILGLSADIFFSHSKEIAQTASSEAVWATMFAAMLGLVFVAIGILARLNERLTALESLRKKADE